jgi:REP element-mobilizing transposase RayT
MEEFVRLMRLYERFCGVRVVTYCVMSNHFHLLVGVPKKPLVQPDNAALIRLVGGSLGELEAQRLAWELGEAAKIGSTGWEEEILERYLRRMWDISLFMKTLKQRFTQWFNRVHKRKGTLWEDRFRSVLVQSAGEPLRAMAAYIDLNPVRAEMVEDPKDYRWSGYGAAMGGDEAALAGMEEMERVTRAGWEPGRVAEAVARLRRLTKRQRHETALEAHRALLYGRGQERGVTKDGRAMRQGFTREESKRVVAEGGRLPKAVYLRCRVRYFTEGAVLGSRAYVNEVYEAMRERFGEKRKTGARRMAGLAKEETLYALRDVKAGAVG